MSALAFDTHAYIKQLKAVGVPEEQAEVQAQAIAKLIDERLVTKEDLAAIKRDLERSIKELEYRLKELEYRLIIRLGAMMVIAIGIVGTMVRLL